MNAGLEGTLSTGQMRGIVAKGRTNDVREIGITSRATNRATHEVYKEGLCGNEKPAVSDPELAKLIRFIARMPVLEVVAVLPQFGKSLLPVNPWITPFTRKKP
ncbi:hypothetical protein OII53_30575 [Achromobacter ruhlandii]|uniref:hypothetical protein n=1 Tax=Achromobacter ruhlandii TaxID=72557 RepID=UPI0021F24DD1|nr:hypothetical protein [Achromobacter ruhlandii]MCV6799504.1 hypothetical protein [Achromobacter ruhlandii]MCV6806738.1 hypothetical protein [Achromobacter ruhlandii]MCV6812029.1 hypothetical protein [Achromobacter ruhlandii]MCV6822913.1 hypothetical protein [Achromobacter ruhlandii]